jgi:hypothetical protein
MKRDVRKSVSGTLWNRTFRGVLVLLFVLVAVTPLLSFADDKAGINGNGDNPYAIGLWGDLPYSASQATTGVPNLIADTS